MEKMNKEQLIEWFIAKYGDHPLLDQFISKEEIRKRLNENIIEVTYNSEPGTSIGAYNNKIINIDLEKIEGEQVVVHEILHALTYNYSNEGYIKCGLKICKYGDFTQEDIKIWIYLNDEEKGKYYKELGRGIDEGVTDWLAEELTGVKNKGYSREKTTTKLLFEVVGRESILRKYFDKDYMQQIHDDFTLEDFYKEEIEAKYQDKAIAGKISEVATKLVTLQDQFTLLLKICNGEIDKLSEENKKLFDVVHKELIETTNDFIQICLENTNSISAKKEILKGALSNSIFGYSLFPQNATVKEAFEQVLASKEISTTEKIAFLEIISDEHILMKINTYEIIGDFWLHNTETSKMPINYRMYKYMKMEGRLALEQFCINEGIINKSDFSKSYMLADFLKAVGFDYGEANSHVNMKLSEVEYQRIGNHYELLVQTDDNELRNLLEENRI